MRYDEFRDQFQDALRDVGLFLQHIGNPIETIELSGTGRRWKVYISRSSPPNTEPFHVTAKIAFDWSPFDAARSCTCGILGTGYSTSKLDGAGFPSV